MGGGLRTIADPFVVAAPAGARVRTRLLVDPTDDQVLWAAGRHLGRLAGLTWPLGAQEVTGSRVVVALGWCDHPHKQRRLGAPQAGSARRASAVAGQDTEDHPPSGRSCRCQEREGHRVRHSGGEVLQARLTEIDNRLAEGRMSVTRGGKALARKRHNLAAAGTCEADWRDRWEAERLFVCADGEAAKRLGNETIRWNPADGILEIKLPAPLDWRTGQAGTTAWHDQSCSPTVGMSGKRRLSPAQSDTTSPTTRTSAAGISTPHGKQTPGGARPSRISGAARCWRST